MNEPKPFASLSSGLLARKGMAKPAMRPHGYGHASSAGLDDLGWNDMGHSRPAPAPIPSPYEAPHQEHVPSPISALTPMTSGLPEEEEEFEPAPPVVEQQRAAIEASFAAPVEERSVLATKAKKPADAEEGAASAIEEAELEPVSASEPVSEAEPAAGIEPEPVRPAARQTAAERRAERERKARAAFTLRLDGERHLKLRLACAVSGRSAQQLVTEALDKLLQSRPEVEALAGQLPQKGSR